MHILKPNIFNIPQIIKLAEHACAGAIGDKCDINRDGNDNRVPPIIAYQLIKCNAKIHHLK